MKVPVLIALLICSIYGKPYNVTDDESTCGYSSCHAIDPDKINVHLIPHSHDDVGWLSTVDQYYYHAVQYIITSVVDALLRNSDRRFIQVETAFFYMWWNQQDESMKSDVRKLINEGRLEIANGAWSMNDEAAVHYQSTIDQFTLGLRFIEDVLGKCARPKAGWQIDPFGHSREHASLLSQFGMDALFFARMDYRDRLKRKEEKSLDLLWTGSASLGSDSNIFTSEFFGHYSSPTNFCFDIDCQDAPIVTDSESPEYNWEVKVNDFANVIRGEYNAFRTNNLLIPMGDDFRYKAAHNDFVNMDRLIEGFKVFNPKIDDKEINLIYSTPSCYTKAVYDYVEANGVDLDVKTDDFFPFAEYPTTVLSGYFSSRASSKRFERFANNLLQVSKQITTLGGRPYGTNKLLSQAVGVMQHHDAITGTEMVHVEKDYHRSISKGMNAALSDINSAFSSILGIENDLNLKSCLLSNVSICTESEKDEFNVLIYNPLARSTSHYIQIPVNDGTWKVTDSAGEDVESHLTEPIRNFDYVTKDIGGNVLPKVLFFRAENLPALGYKVYNFKKTNSKSTSVRVEKLGSVDQMGFANKYVNFDLDTGLLKSITLNGVTMAVSQKMMYYVSGGSSAYTFDPENKSNAVEFGNVDTSVLINDGNLVREVKQVWKDWVTQIIRIYKEEDFIEFDWVIGPADVSDGKGKEIITRYTTELNANEEFYTDANGREMIYRKKNYRPTFEYTDEEPQAGNYYPVATKILVKDETSEFAVLTDRSEGGASLSSGEIELMLSRALLQDFNGESLNEEEYQQSLVVRGSHFVTLGQSNIGNGGRTMAAVERDIAQRKLLQPWVFYTSEDIPVKEQSFLNKELPLNVHLLTLEQWNETENTVLIRLEHILEKNEDPQLSKEVTVDISDLFKTFKIKSMKEYMLAANTPIEESSRLKWSQVSKTEEDFNSLNLKNRLARDEDDLKITLAPMQIRTFVATLETDN